MITHKKPYYYCARVCFECQSPLSIKADDSDPTLDTTLMLDANGNAIIPGTSISGVLRHLYQEKYKDDSLFGTSGIQHSDNQTSAVKISFGFIHNAQNKPQMGAVTTDRESDEILIHLQNEPIIRAQNAINKYGTVSKGGKFDRSALPKGTRFSFELGLSINKDEKEGGKQWEQLLGLLSHPKFRLGGLTHRGFGKIEVIDIQERKFDFRKEENFNSWKTYQQESWTAHNNLQAQVNESKDKYVKLAVKAEDFWRIGSGNKALETYDKDPDDKPYTESVIKWEDNNASIQDKIVVVPATGIKGALRHRTLFHLRLLHNDFLDTETKEEEAKKYKNLCQLFGDKAEKKTQQGVGGLFIDDVYLAEYSTPKMMMHNKIDRFTGGVMNGALFSEELLYQDTLNIPMYFDPYKLKGLDRCTQTAFITALKDLCEGRLSLGGGSAKGHGYFTGNSKETVTKFTEACQWPY